MKLELTRTYYANGTNGELRCEGRLLCRTIELPWLDNRPHLSCIPEGVYELQKRYSARFGRHLLVNGVPNRSYILIHAFNNARSESKGCIAPVSFFTGEGKGMNSRSSLELLLQQTYPGLEKGNKIFITIKKKEHENTDNAGAIADTPVF